MSANVTTAANAYLSAANLLDKSAQQKASTGALGDAGGFSELVKSALESTNETGKATEASVADLASGKANVVDLVTAVAETELAVQTLVTVRDRVISAYQEIMNMPI
ncbi:MAG: flagellar hook-basal body complex protein FliE [Hyphomicrobiales bacterium]|nr:flagellar hook-basal body complex protein FliE [Hyphomicrobiales bacterium]